MILDNKIYDIVKWATMIVIPAAGTCYATIATICGLPYGTQVEGVALALTTFFGVILKVSHSNYTKSDLDTDGTIIIDQENPEMVFTELSFDESIAKAADKSRVVLRVDNESTATNPSLYTD